MFHFRALINGAAIKMSKRRSEVNKYTTPGMEFTNSPKITETLDKKISWDDFPEIGWFSVSFNRELTEINYLKLPPL